MKIFSKAILSISLLVVVSSASFAESTQENLQTYLQNYKQLAGSFTQVISSDQSGRTQSSTGRFWIKKPGKFRWHYTTPYIQKIISNGKKLWVYDEDLEQVTTKSAAQSIDSSPLAIILGSASLDKIFIISQLADRDGLKWLKLAPKEESSGFESIKIGFKDGILTRMSFQDSFGQRTRLLFTDMSVNTLLADELFEFKAPEGADVFDETSE